MFRVLPHSSGYQGDSYVAEVGTIHIEIPLGVVIRKSPGVTRWAKWSWAAVAVLPGAGPAQWTELRREGDAVDYLRSISSFAAMIASS